MDDGSPTLGVGFAINTAGSFDELIRLQGVMDTTEAKVVADAERIERATKGMVSVGGATAAITSFGSAATRELQATAREMSRVEKSGEAMVRQLERQNASFGKTREELRSLRAEEQALAADRVGNTDLAQRIRSAEAAIYAQEFAAARRAAQAAEDAAAEQARAALTSAAAREQEARALRAASLAHATFEARVREGAKALREQEAAEKAIQRDQAAAAMAREAAAAQKLAQEHAELAAAVRASHAAQLADAAAAERLRMSTDPLYAATVRINAEIAESTRLYHAGVTPAAEYARQQEVLADRLRMTGQAHDTMVVAAKRGSGSLTQLSFQLNDVATMAMAGSPPFQIFATQIGQIIQVAQQAEGGVKGLAGEIGSFLLRFSPVIGVLAAGAAGFMLFDRAVSKGVDTKAMIDSLGLTKDEIEKLKNTSVSTGDVVKATFQVLAERVGLHLDGMTKFFGAAMDWITVKGRQSMAIVYAAIVGTFRAGAAAAQNITKGPAAVLSAMSDAYVDAFDQADGALKRFGADVTKQVAANKLADLRKQAQKLKEDRTPKTDRHAEQLEREGRAIEAQIRNLYLLADAYGVSGAAALIAEARVKAESEAIKKRADIGERVARQVRLAVAQRVADAAKDTAGMRDQAVMQEKVNGLVAAGTVPAALANETLRDRIADLPLLAALEAAKTVNDVKGAEAAADALDKQRAARERLTDAERQGQMDAALQTGKDRIAELREEIRLIGATDAARTRSLAVLRATQTADNNGWTGRKAAETIEQAGTIADLETQRQLRADAYNASLTHQADLLDAMASNAQNAARGMADAFGEAGRALGSMAAIFTAHLADQARLKVARDEQLRAASEITSSAKRQQREQQINGLFAVRNASAQVGLYGDMASAAKGFFKEGSDGYKAMEKAEKAFRAVEFALSVRAIAQDAIETASSIAKSGIRTAKYAVEAVVKAISSLPFPLNIAAGAATVAALAAIGVSVAGGFGGGKNTLEKANDGTGTVLGDSKAQSESIKRSIDALRAVDTLTNTYAREMAGSLRSIDNQIGGLATVLVRAGDINASAGITEGFKPNLIGSLLGKVPLVGGFLSSLFGSKTNVTGSGLFGGPQTLASILGSGFDASTYSDIKKTSKFLGITTGTKYSTQYAAADPQLEKQFTLLLRSFSDAIGAAAVPLGVATSEIEQRLAGFVVNIGKIDLKDLTGEEIEAKLQAVFGAAADNMAAAAFPTIQQFQRAGEGAFETLVRVASTIEQVGSSLDMLGTRTQNMSIAAKLALADQFDSVSDLTSAAEAYFRGYYSQEEQVAAQRAQMARVFTSLGLAMPETLAGFRALVEAQDLTTAAGQSTYATLLQLAPAFADLAEALTGAKSAADILAERQDLERRLLELRGDTAALRALDLAKLDVSNRALQQQVWMVEDAQKAATAAEQLRQAWTSIGDGIADEVKRIRGITDEASGGGFATLQGRFNAATTAARAGDQDAAKSLPGLSQALLRAAELQATSRQELERIQAQTAASLETTLREINGQSGSNTIARTADTLLAAASATQAATTPTAANDDLAAELRAMRAELAQLRSDNNAGHAATAGNTGRIAARFDDVTAAAGGEAITVAGVAA